MPGASDNCEITHVYGVEEAYAVLKYSMLDYEKKFEGLSVALQNY